MNEISLFLFALRVFFFFLLLLSLLVRIPCVKVIICVTCSLISSKAVIQGSTPTLLILNFLEVSK